MPEFIERIFNAIDNKDASGFAEFFAEDAAFIFGNAQAVSGRANIENAVSAFFSSIKALKHRISEAWVRDNVIICEGEVTYTRMDNHELTLPFADIIRLRDRLIVDYRVYIDISPLFT